MRSGLFRQQAIAHQRLGFRGGLLMTPKPSYMFATCVLIMWVVLVGLFLSTNSYARKTTVTGWLEPSHGIQKVYAEQRRGVIFNVYVSEGQWVAKGTPLVAINYGVQERFNHNVEDSLVDEIESNALRLKTAIARLKRQHKNEQQQLNKRLSNATLDARALDAISTLSEQQYQLANQQFSANATLLTSGSISKAALNNSQIQAINTRRQWQQAKRDRAQKYVEISELEY